MSAIRRLKAREAAFFETLFGIRVRRLQGLFGAHWQRWYRQRGLTITPVQGGLLMAIRANPGISQIMLARLMRIEPPTLVQALAPLMKQGFINRRRSPGDGRVFELLLSDAGMNAADTVEETTPEHEAHLLRGLTREERRQFLHLLDKALAGGEEAIASVDTEEAAVS